MTGARRVAEAVAERGGPMLVYGSSLHVYGPGLTGEVDANRPYGPQSDLAHLSKVYAELCLGLHARRGGFDLAVLRLGIVYGPSPVEHERPESQTVVDRFRRLAEAGEDAPARRGRKGDDRRRPRRRRRQDPARVRSRRGKRRSRDGHRRRRRAACPRRSTHRRAGLHGAKPLRLPPHRSGVPRAVRAVVTGARGFLGSRVADLLEEAGHEVVRVSRPEGARRALAGDAIELDAGDPVARDLLAGAAAVFHFAGVPDPARARSDPAWAVRQNAGTTLNLLEGCREHGCGLVFPSTLRAALDPPPDPYALSKRLGEETCRLHAGSGDRCPADLRLRARAGRRRRCHGRDRGLRGASACGRADRHPGRPGAGARLRLRRRPRAGPGSGSSWRQDGTRR